MSTPVTETVEEGKSKVAFARRAQNWVMAFLIISLVCVAQPFSLQLYGYGIFLLGIAVFLQIAVSNVTPTAQRCCCPERGQPRGAAARRCNS